MQFCSTRNSSVRVSACEAIVKGISPDGGLFVPIELPEIFESKFDRLFSCMNYGDFAAEVLSTLIDDIDYDTLRTIAQKAYSSFDGSPAPLTELEPGLYALELWHGPTCAFKDMALQIMPLLFSEAKKRIGNSSQTLILVATSGDTGKAALEGYADVEGIKIAVIYPRNGVSKIQRLQMATQSGNNVAVFGINGNFDDAQRAVKEIMTNNEIISELKDSKIEFSSANSINFGRLAPQIVYYFYSYFTLLANKNISKGTKVDFCVPSGNFGNILAAYYAKLMGLPVGRLIVASNMNRVICEFVNFGAYNADRPLALTISPSMDILVSSNIERLVWQICDKNSDRVDELYKCFAENKSFELSYDEFIKVSDEFTGYHCDESQTREQIKKVFNNYGYLIDTHTAVAFGAVEQYAESKSDNNPVVIVSTANPYKFSESVLYAAFGEEKTGFDAIEELEIKSGMKAPSQLIELKNKAVRFDGCFEKEQLVEKIEAFAGVRG